jgi:L-threonylcarbamoyladenylate synthase
MSVRRVIVNPERPEAAAIAEAVDVLKSGGVVAFPTDTLYGLAVDPRSADAIGRLFLLKSRDRHAALPFVAADLDQAMAAGTFGPAERRAVAAFWPGPLTVVVKAHASISPAALGGGDTVAVRVPAHAVARALAAGFGFCVTATSANSSGQPPTASPDAVAAALPEVDLLLDGGPAPGGPPSTIISFDHDVPLLLRAGAIAWDRVLKSLQ